MILFIESTILTVLTLAAVLMADFTLALIRYRVEIDEWEYPLDGESIKKVFKKTFISQWLYQD